jgi:DNA invertase Pin-like site-specific DNA recombinase
MVSRHLDGNKLNNNLSNLKYGTQLENNQDAVKHGTHSTQKLDAEDVRDIRRLGREEKYTLEQLAKEFGIGRSQVKRIINKESWKHI